MLVGAGSPAEQVAFSAFEFFVDAKTVIGCVYGSTDADRDFPVLVDLVRQGAIDAEGLVTRRIGLDDIDDAFRAMEAGEVGEKRDRLRRDREARGLTRRTRRTEA